MNIKEKIGCRIAAERKAKGLTRKALAELTDDLTQSRINNYERGDRTPGPEEIKQLARALKISPAFLMCLTDSKDQHFYKSPIGTLVPLLDHQQASSPGLCVQAIKNEQYNEPMSFIPISHELALSLGENAFAIKMQDDSMEPELRLNDVLIVDPDQEPKPGGFVVAKLTEGSGGVLMRRYKQLSASQVSQEYELMAINDAWASIRIHNSDQCKIVGVVISVIRKLTS